MYQPDASVTTDLDDPDLAVDEGGFEAFAEIVAAAVVGSVADVASAAVDGTSQQERSTPPPWVMPTWPRPSSRQAR